MQSVNHVLKDIGQVVAMETPVAHFELGYMGTFDCLAEYRGRLCLIDWKTSTRLKPSLADCYDYPLQAVAYAGAINQDPNINLKVTSNGFCPLMETLFTLSLVGCPLRTLIIYYAGAIIMTVLQITIKTFVVQC